MNKVSKQSVRKQYKNPANLDARRYLQEKFSLNKNKQTWYQWVFDQFDFPKQPKILELGCGLGSLWLDNEQRISRFWDITLSDFSEEMLNKTKENLSKLKHDFRFEIVDAENIPYDDETFDIVIANGLLYLLPDLPRALMEMARVLKPGGVLVALTTATKKELADLLKKSELPVHANYVESNFTPENGENILRKNFTEVKLIISKGELLVTESKPMADYVLSTNENLNPEQRDRVYKFFEDFFRKNHQLYISNEVGLFFARK